jgi:hypothetical protein
MPDFIKKHASLAVMYTPTVLCATQLISDRELWLMLGGSIIGWISALLHQWYLNSTETSNDS